MLPNTRWHQETHPEPGPGLLLERQVSRRDLRLLTGRVAAKGSTMHTAALAYFQLRGTRTHPEPGPGLLLKRQVSRFDLRLLKAGALLGLPPHASRVHARVCIHAWVGACSTQREVRLTGATAPC